MRFFFVAIFLLFSGLIFADGKELFKQKNCVSCHGADAEGIQLLKAPALAGQSYEYLLRQLQIFQKRARGNDRDKNHATVMWQQAGSLTASEMKDLSKYLASMKPVKTKTTVSGWATNGKAHYATCATCHGANAEGNDSLGAPNLAVLNDWYIVEQLQAFRSGKRGVNPQTNPYGTQMAPMAMTVPDLEAMEDLALYIKNIQAIE